MDVALEDYDALVKASYDAAFDPRKWQDFCQKLDAVVDGAYVGLHAHDLRVGKNAGYYMTRHPEAFVESYRQYYDALNPILPGLLRTRIGEPVETEEIISYEELFATEYYNDWMRPQENIGAGCGIVLFRSPTRLVTVGCQIRLVDADAKLGGLMRLLRLLGPHLQRAFEVQRALEGKVLTDQLGWQALEALETPVVFLDRLLRPLHMNRAARALFEERLALRLGSGGRLALVDADADGFLQSAVAAILAGECTYEKTARPLRLRAGEAPVVLRVVPVPPRQIELFPGPFSAAAPPVAMLSLGAAKPTPQMALAIFGLTPAETALALSLAGGRSLARHAEARRVSIHTVRNQLRSVFAKTGTSRQSELVALLAGLC